MKTIDEILKSFDNPFDQYIEQKPVYSKKSKTGTVDYIPWYAICDILDQLAPGWEWEVSCDYHGERTVVVGRLTIHGSDRSLTRSATGNETNDCGSYGDPCSNAEAMALRRAAAKFGIGRYLWAKSEKSQAKPQSYSDQSPSNIFKSSPTQKGTISKEEYERRFKQYPIKMEALSKESAELNREAMGNIP
jgi:hypothetical protein